MKTQTSAVISEEIAEKELIDFYNHYALIPGEDTEILDELEVAKIALMKGLLQFDDDKVPTYTLKDPLKNEAGEETLSKIVFKTRIFPNEHVRLSKGLNIQKQTMEYALRCQAHLADLPSVSYLNKLSKFDYTVVQQIGTVFA
jgi:hypothetical protein